MKTKRGQAAWYGFDLDGTLAYHGEGDSLDHIGDPIPSMIRRAQEYLARGEEVRIVTARVAPEFADAEEQAAKIRNWCEKHIGERLTVQAHKNGGMVLLYDDRAVGVRRNAGVLLNRPEISLEAATKRVEEVFFNRTDIRMDPRIAEAIAHEVLKCAD
jgi:hypothetical protein